MHRQDYLQRAINAWSWLEPELTKLRKKAPHLARATQELGRSGLVLARPVWARPEARFSRVLEPLVASAAFLALLGTIATALVSVFGVILALGLALLILRFVFGIKVDAPDLNYSA